MKTNIDEILGSFCNSQSQIEPKHDRSFTCWVIQIQNVEHEPQSLCDLAEQMGKSTKSF